MRGRGCEREGKVKEESLRSRARRADLGKHPRVARFATRLRARGQEWQVKITMTRVT